MLRKCVTHVSLFSIFMHVANATGESQRKTFLTSLKYFLIFLCFQMEEHRGLRHLRQQVLQWNLEKVRSKGPISQSYTGSSCRHYQISPAPRKHFWACWEPVDQLLVPVELLKFLYKSSSILGFTSTLSGYVTSPYNLVLLKDDSVYYACWVK